MPVCPQCGTENPSAARFCMACGTTLAAEPAAQDVRKTVTVLFSDVVGSTPLGERLDPETLRRLMSRYFDRMKGVVERHGGVVEKFIGDAVMAVFGIPAVHEDDALRAVRAAAEMREGLAGLNRELQREHGVTVEARTGVNTGEVVAGDPSRGQTLATGDAINTAARLQQAAGPGEILLGAPTFRLVRDGVKVDTMEPLELKGKETAVEAFRLQGVLPEAEAIPRRLDSPMVGRDRERQLLRLSFDRAVEEKTCHLVTVLGAAGVGKSRLIEEFLGSLAHDVTVLRGRCLPYGEGITFWPVAEVIRSAAGIGEEEPSEDARAKLKALCEGDEAREVIYERVAQVLGLTSDSAVPEETFWAIRKLLEALARRGPLVVVFDDIHWAEPTFLDLIEHLADFSRDAPFLLVCLSRQELLDRRPGWGGGKVNATTMLLEPLDESECDVLMENLLGRARLSEEARSRIVEAAEGNPLFVEEMLSMLIDEGLLVRRNGDWIPTSDLSTVSVPPTIQALLAARLEQLDGEERAIMQRASVVGRIFYRGAVAELSPEPARPAVGSHLATLVRRELIRPHATEFSDETYRFRHILIRDAAYEAMPKEIRAELHERFAAWLEARVGERLREYEEFLGYHLEQAHRYSLELGPEDDRARALARNAAGRFASAATRAQARGDAHAEVNLLSRAVALLPQDDPSRLKLLPDLGEALVDAGELHRADEVLAEAVEASAKTGNRLIGARAAVPRLFLSALIHKAEDSAILTEAERLTGVLEEMGDEQGVVRAGLVVGTSHFFLGSCAKAEQIVSPLIDRARRADDRRGEIDALSWLTAILFWGPTPVSEAIRRVDEMRVDGAGDPIVEGSCLRVQIALHAMEGRFEEGRALAARTRAIAEELGQFVRLGALGFWLGPLEMLAGDFAAAERVMRESYEALDAMGERGYLSTIAGALADALWALGRAQEAERFAFIAKDAAASDDFASQVLWRSVLAKVRADAGRIEEAVELARRAVEICEPTDYLDMRGNAHMDAADVFRTGARTEEAVESIRAALELYERKGNTVSAGRARQFLEELEARG